MSAMSEDDTPPGTDALVEFIEANYGDRFDDDRRDELRERVGSLREAGEELSDVDLANDDEPATTFRAYRGEE